MSKIWWFGLVRYYSRSPEIAPINRRHTSSYKRSIATMSLCGTGSQILVENRQFEPTPISIWDDPVGILQRSLASENESLGYHVALFA